MSKFTNLLGFGVVAAALLSPQVLKAQFDEPLFDPVPNTYTYENEDAKYLAGEIQKITITWEGTELELNTSVTCTCQNWTTWESVNLKDYMSVEGDKLIINFPLDEPGTWDFSLAPNLVTDLKTNKKNSNRVSFQFIVSPLSIESFWFNSDPGVNPTSLSAFGPQISLTLPGYTIESVTNISSDPYAFTYSGPYNSIFDFTESSFANPDDYEEDPNVEEDPDLGGSTSESQFGKLYDTLKTVESATLTNGAVNINLGKTFTDPGMYVLRIGENALTCSNGEKSNITVDNFQILVYRVQGFGFYPNDNATLTGNFPGLTVLGDNVEISNVSSIKIYEGFVSTDDENNEDEPFTPVILGSGASVEDADVNGQSGKTIYFNYTDGDLYNGAYTIYIPTGSIKVDGSAIKDYQDKPYNYYHFNIEGSLAPCPAVDSNPTPGVVKSLGTIQVIWGSGSQPDAGNTPSIDYYGCVLERGSGAVTLTLPNGKTASVLASVLNATESNDLDGVVTLGSVYSIQTDGYTTPGKYTLSIPAGLVNVVVNKYSTVPNDPVTLEYYIEGLEMENATLLTTMVGLSSTYPAAAITWNKGVSLVDASSVSLPVTCNGQSVGNLTAQYLNLVPAAASEPGVSPMALTGDSGDILYLLLGSAGLLKEVGTYTIQIPANTFVSVDGEFNQDETITITCVEKLAEGVVTPEDATFSISDEIEIQISFPDAKEVNLNPNALETPVIVTNYDDFTQRLTWSNALTLENNVINVDLGKLAAGNYTLTLTSGQVLADEIYNEELEYNFLVDNPEGISTVGNELNNSEVVIYNLNGVRVNPANLSKGLYIINGKKVMVK